jgi:hypothetical protein
MPKFENQPFAQRLKVMGDTAERKFEEVWEKPFSRFGFHRPEFSVNNLPKLILHMPDYIDSVNLIEVKGFGRDQTFKVKVLEYGYMQQWDQVHPLLIFVWDSHRKRYTDFPLKALTEWINSGVAELGYFPEPKAYFAVPAKEVFAWET